MLFTRFSANTTNIFPIANTVRGGQLMSEFNLRSREGVGVGPHAKDDVIEYMIGPSYVHGEMDFYCRPLMDGIGLVVEPSVLEILPGRAVINGHFIENLAPMTIDLRDANAIALQAPEIHGPELKGDLIVGLRCIYATQQTLSGTIDAENFEEMYQGIQIVILPPAVGTRTIHTFNLPVDVPKDENLVTAHIELARFHYSNGRITGANARNDNNPIVNNYPGKSQYIDGLRVFNFEQFIDDIYVKKTGLNPDKIYAMAGRGAEEQATWDDITSNLMVWDKNPDPQKVLDPNQAMVGTEAQFVANIPAFKGKTKFVLPRKQVEGMQDSHGNRKYYLPKIYDLPLADFVRGTSGTVDRKYTNHIKNLLQKVNQLHNLPSGKQRLYISKLADAIISTKWSVEGTLPPINMNWRPGDYILVGEDTTLSSSNDTVRPPSSLYPVIPGYVMDVEYGGATNSIAKLPAVFVQLQEATIRPNSDSKFTGAVGGVTYKGTPHTHIIDDTKDNPRYDGYDTISYRTELDGEHSHEVFNTIAGQLDHHHQVKMPDHDHTHTIETVDGHIHGFDNVIISGAKNIMAGSDVVTSAPIWDKFDDSDAGTDKHVHHIPVRAGRESDTTDISVHYCGMGDTTKNYTGNEVSGSLPANIEAAEGEHPHRHTIDGEYTNWVTCGANAHRHKVSDANIGEMYPDHEHSIDGSMNPSEPHTHTLKIDKASLIATSDRTDLTHNHPPTSVVADHTHEYNIKLHSHGLTTEDEHTHNLDTMAVQLGSANFQATILAKNEPFVGVELARVTEGGRPPITLNPDDKQAVRDMFNIPSEDELGCLTCTSDMGYMRGVINQDYVIYEDTSIPLPSDLGGFVYSVSSLADRLNLHPVNGDIVTVAENNLCYRFNAPTGYIQGQTTLLSSHWALIDGLTRENALGLRYHFYRVSATKPNEYGSPILVTGETPLATQQKIGGFLNVDESHTDQGYVRINDEGHLQLVDYSLLRSGVLAYQLGEDFHTPAGITIDEMQLYLDEYVNQRVAFPNWNQQQYSDEPNVIHIYLNFSADETGTLNVYDIDSRFNSSVYIHINGSVGNDCIINISDCAKVRIDPNFGVGTIQPIVNLYRSNLYYDAEVLNKLHIIADLSLWYERFDELDPDLVINGMEVREVGNPIIPTGTNQYNYWEINSPNDNHFQSALRSLTFGKDGTIIGWEVLVKNDSTPNVLRGNNNMRVTKVFSFPFTIPQGATFNYPSKRVKKPLKVTGNFVNGYKVTDGKNSPYIILNTSFTILSHVYDEYAETQEISGTISFFQDAIEVNAQDVTHTGTPITGWDSGEFHIFRGGSLQ